jgi:Helicase HerA, central domain
MYLADNYNKLNIRDIPGKSIAVLGIKGSGKTNTAAVLIEEMLAGGVPLTIIDIEGEYWGLKEKYDMIIAGAGEHVEINLTEPLQASTLAAFSLQERVPVILDLSDLESNIQAEMLAQAYLESLWTTARKVRTPYQIVIEEAHEWIPQSGKTLVKEVISRIAKRGRKRGLNLTLVSQRSARVDKDSLTQSDIYILHRVVHSLDIDVYKEVLPLPAKEVENIVPALADGEALVLYKHIADKVQIRQRHTHHAGTTPELDKQVEAKLKTTDVSSLLKKLEAIKPELGSGTGTVSIETETETAYDKPKSKIRRPVQGQGQKQAGSSTQNTTSEKRVVILENKLSDSQERYNQLIKERDAAIAEATHWKNQYNELFASYKTTVARITKNNESLEQAILRLTNGNGNGKELEATNAAKQGKSKSAFPSKIEVTGTITTEPGRGRTTTINPTSVNVKTATTTVQTSAPVSQKAATATASSTKVKWSDILDLLTPTERTRLKNLTAKFSKQVAFHQRVARDLLDAYQQRTQYDSHSLEGRGQIPLPVLARRVGIEFESLYRKAPLELIRLGLIKREKQFNKQIYYSLSVNEFIRNYFSSLDKQPEAVKIELLKKIMFDL